jgi:hypothetical protein
VWLQNGTGIQPSPHSIIASIIRGPGDAPMNTGGWGLAAGFGHIHDGPNEMCSPANDASSCVHRTFIASTCSRTYARRSFHTTPWCSASSTFQP